MTNSKGGASMKVSAVGRAGMISGGAGDASPFNAPMIVDRIVEAESTPIASAKERRNQTTNRRDEIKSLDGLLSKLKASADSIKAPSGFLKSKLESSHPDIISGTAVDGVSPGSYEVAVEGLARSARQISLGFPDPDKTEVGFGFMRLVSPNGSEDLVINPGATLKDVAASINNQIAGVRASIINTGMTEEPFRLLVSSAETGEALDLMIDPDTTFTEFNALVKPQDLKLKFEGVDIKRATNALSDLVEGVSLKASRAAPGTNVTVTVGHDVNRTAEGVRDFVTGYNEIHSFARRQSTRDDNSGQVGGLMGDSTLRQVSSSLRRSLSEQPLTSIGITTNPKTGELLLDEKMLMEALSKDYDSVAGIFATSASGPGLAGKMSDAIKTLQDRSYGAVATRIKGLEDRIRRQDDEIARKEERMSERKAQLQRTFSSLDAKLASMTSQGQVLASRLGSSDQISSNAEGPG
jgi:flagellar hook-associated protein 2